MIATQRWRYRIFPQGITGVIVECYEIPQEGYVVDLAIPDPTLVGEFDYENLVLKPEHFAVITPANTEKKEPIEGLLVAN